MWLKPMRLEPFSSLHDLQLNYVTGSDCQSHLPEAAIAIAAITKCIKLLDLDMSLVSINHINSLLRTTSNYVHCHFSNMRQVQLEYKCQRTWRPQTRSPTHRRKQWPSISISSAYKLANPHEKGCYGSLSQCGASKKASCSGERTW